MDYSGYRPAEKLEVETKEVEEFTDVIDAQIAHFSLMYTPEELVKIFADNGVTVSLEHIQAISEQVNAGK